jgi:hypothetical protein
VVTPMYLVTGYGILFALRRLERRFAMRAEKSWISRSARFPSSPTASG